jgi:hypothetical protein
VEIVFEIVSGGRRRGIMVNSILCVIIKMYFMIYILSFMLIFCFFLCIIIRYKRKSIKRFQSRFNHDNGFNHKVSYCKKYYTDDEKVNKLNTLWSMYPTDQNSLIFMHSFDGITNTSNFGDWKGYCDDKSSWPWCPASSASLSNWYHTILGINIPMPPLKLPIESVSFSALNKHITPLEGEIIYNQDNASGLIFKYFNDKLISPMCYYPSDGATIVRNNGGCGNLGLQMQPISLNEYGYNMNTTKDDMSGKEVYEQNKHFTILGKFLLQKSLNINQFLDVTRIQSESSFIHNFFSVNNLYI